MKKELLSLFVQCETQLPMKKGRNIQIRPKSILKLKKGPGLKIIYTPIPTLLSITKAQFRIQIEESVSCCKKMHTSNCLEADKYKVNDKKSVQHNQKALVFFYRDINWMLYTGTSRKMLKSNWFEKDGSQANYYTAYGTGQRAIVQ